MSYEYEKMLSVAPNECAVAISASARSPAINLHNDHIKGNPYKSKVNEI